MFSGIYVFEASQVYQCLTSVPFNDAVALRFVDYYNETMQFHSTLAYLKDPPEGYQQPSVDLVDALAVIKQNITAGYYKNQYAFEAEVQKLVYSVHDMHVDLWAGILSAFSFGSEYEIVSVSKDGKELPQLYLTGKFVQVCESSLKLTESQATSFTMIIRSPSLLSTAKTPSST